MKELGGDKHEMEEDVTFAGDTGERAGKSAKVPLAASFRKPYPHRTCAA